MSEIYEDDPFFVAYVKWHYGKGLKELFGVIGNFLWFASNFFSFKLLTKTLFSPWKRLGEHYGGGFNLAEFASTLVVNTLMRIVGFVTRTVVLFVGFVSYLLILVFSLFAVFIWVFAPAILLGTAVLSAIFFVA